MTAVLHLIETAGTGGAETVFVDLVDGLDGSRWRSVAVLPGTGWVASQLSARGIEPIVLDEPRRIDTQYFVNLARLVRLIQREKIELIHAHMFGMAVRAALLSTICGIPAIATLHGAIDLSPTEHYQRLKLALINRGLRRLVFVSEPFRQSFLASVDINPALATVIPNGVNAAKFAAGGTMGRARLGLGGHEFVVGAIGNALPAKGFDILLHAVAALKRSGVLCRVVIVGEMNGACGDELRRLRVDLGLEGDALFTGFRGDVPDLLSAFDVFVVPSRSEGFSLVAVEAMAAGIPVVAARCGGPEQVLEHEITGVLVPNESPEALAGAIAALRQDSGRRDRLAAAGRLRAMNEFGLETQLHAYEQLYESVIGRHVGRAHLVPATE